MATLQRKNPTRLKRNLILEFFIQSKKYVSNTYFSIIIKIMAQNKYGVDYSFSKFQIKS